MWWKQPCAKFIQKWKLKKWKFWLLSDSFVIWTLDVYRNSEAKEPTEAWREEAGWPGEGGGQRWVLTIVHGLWSWRDSEGEPSADSSLKPYLRRWERGRGRLACPFAYQCGLINSQHNRWFWRRGFKSNTAVRNPGDSQFPNTYFQDCLNSHPPSSSYFELDTLDACILISVASLSGWKSMWFAQKRPSKGQAGLHPFHSLYFLVLWKEEATGRAREGKWLAQGNKLDGDEGEAETQALTPAAGPFGRM